MGQRITAAQKLKEFRLRLHLTQEKFAESIGYTQPYYSTLEQGSRELSLSMLQKIGEVYGLPVSYFFESEPRADIAAETAVQLRAEIAEKLESCDAPLLRRISGIIDVLKD